MELCSPDEMAEIRARHSNDGVPEPRMDSIIEGTLQKTLVACAEVSEIFLKGMLNTNNHHHHLHHPSLCGAMVIRSGIKYGNHVMYVGQSEPLSHAELSEYNYDSRYFPCVDISR